MNQLATGSARKLMGPEPSSSKLVVSEHSVPYGTEQVHADGVNDSNIGPQRHSEKEKVARQEEEKLARKRVVAAIISESGHENATYFGVESDAIGRAMNLVHHGGLELTDDQLENAQLIAEAFEIEDEISAAYDEAQKSKQSEAAHPVNQQAPPPAPPSRKEKPEPTANELAGRRRAEAAGNSGRLVLLDMFAAKTLTRSALNAWVARTESTDIAEAQAAFQEMREAYEAKNPFAAAPRIISRSGT